MYLCIYLRISGSSLPPPLWSYSQAVTSTERVGTPHYHAPETVQGEGHGLAAQLWALGVLIAEMVDGTPPFWAPGPESTVR